MPDMTKSREYWNSLTVEERRKELDARVIRPAVKEMIDKIDHRRKYGPHKQYDLVPHFIAEYKSMKKENTLEGNMAMKMVYKCAQQTMTKKNFARFKEGIR